MTDMMSLRRWRVLPLVLLFAACNGEDPIDPDPCDSANPPASCEPGPDPDAYVFAYQPPAGAPNITSLVVRGSFNEWGPPNGSDLVMEEQANGTWTAEIELDSATTYHYKFVFNGEWVGNMCADDTWGHDDQGGLVHLEADGCIDDGFGGANAVLILAEQGLNFSHHEGQAADVSVAHEILSVRFRARAGVATSAAVVVGEDTIDAHVQFRRGLEDVWRAALPVSTTSYTILVESDDGAETFGPYDVPANPFRTVSWASDAVAYQIFPERFWNGDPSNDSLALETDEYVFSEVPERTAPTMADSWDTPPNNQHCCHQYYGGDLAGIIEKLPELADLGVNVIYLNPIWDAGSAHGYDTHDYRRLAPEYGDSTVLRTFLDAAHALDMNVIWDFVPNHSGLGFWAFQDAVENGQASPYWNWFNFKVPEDEIVVGNGNHYDGWWGLGSLPEIQTEVATAFDYLMNVAVDWTEYGFDGIRVDVPGDIDNRSTFFSTFRSVTKAADPDVYLVGEIWERNPSWLQGTEFDALMNYAIGREVVGRFVLGQVNATGAWNAMVELYASYPEAASAMLFNVIATHDTERLLTFMGGGELGQTPNETALQRQRLASAFLYALPGMPVTFYGDECAMLGTNTGSIHRARATMDWDRCAADAFGMVAHYRLLAEEKRNLPALGSSVIRAHRAEGSVLSFYRGEPGAGEVLAVFNQGATPAQFALPAGTWVDAMIPGDQVTGSVSIDARGWRYLVRQ